jgi:glutamate racemase
LDRDAIGIFDSGVGGLTVMHQLIEALPAESLVYLGDTGRYPYGNKSPETVTRYSLENAAFLVDKGIKLLVVACNAASSVALGVLKAECPVPVVGVIEPGARAAVKASRGGGIGVIGTVGTIASNAYARAIRATAPAVRVEQLACPLFVPLVEEGWFDRPATELIAAEYLAPLRRAGIDTLVLGCTHYPLLKPLLERVMGPGVTLIDSAHETAAEVAHVLALHHLAAPDGHSAAHRFAVSDDEARFRRVGTRFIGERLGSAEVVPMG